MSFQSKLLGGVGASAWGAALNFLATPFYLHFLGIEAYGLIGLYVALQAIMNVLDMGIGPTVSREIARDTSKGRSPGSRALLITLSRFYGIGVLLFVPTAVTFVALNSQLLVKASSVSANDVRESLFVVIFILALRWPVVLYQSVLIGADRFLLMASVNALMVSLTVGSSLIVVAFLSAKPQAFFFTQMLVAGLHLAVVRTVAWRVIGGKQDASFDLSRLRQVWKFAAGTGAIALTSVAFTQLDKFIISRLEGLESFGYYALAVAASSALYLIVSPVFNIIYPRMSALIAQGALRELTSYYSLGSRLLSFLIIPIGLSLAFYAEDVIYLWTQDSSVAGQAGPLLSLLAVGSSLHALMFFPYAAQLALGNTRLPLAINIGLMVASVPALVFAVSHLGALGGAIAWLGLQITYLLVGSWLTNRYLLGIDHFSWFSRVGILPILVVGAAVYLSGSLVNQLTASPALRILLASAIGSAIIVLLVSSSSDTRRFLSWFASGRSRVNVDAKGPETEQG